MDAGVTGGPQVILQVTPLGQRHLDLKTHSRDLVGQSAFRIVEET